MNASPEPVSEQPPAFFGGYQEILMFAQPPGGTGYVDRPVLDTQVLEEPFHAVEIRHVEAVYHRGDGNIEAGIQGVTDGRERPFEHAGAAYRVVSGGQPVDAHLDFIHFDRL